MDQTIIFTTFLVAVYVSYFQACYAANILAIIPTISPSHHFWNRALMLELAARGHTLTIVSPNLEKIHVPNYKRQILLEGSYEATNDEYEYESLDSMTVMENIHLWFLWGQFTCEYELNTNGSKSLLELAGKEKFDLIIFEQVFVECFLGFIDKFNSPPVIGIVTFSHPQWASQTLANPIIPSYIPHLYLPYSDQMTFKERLVNAFVWTYMHYYRKYVHLPIMEEISKKFFGDSMRPLSEIEKSMSLLLVNTHFSLDFPRPLLPSVIEVSGLHIKEPKPLPENIAKFVNESKEGFILFSIGSNLRSDLLRPETIKAVMAAFAQLPLRVLWKYESDLPGKPENVMISKWIPQNDVLAHPNIKLFMTHNGLLSTQEAVYRGVPCLCMPFVCDQIRNSELLVKRGLGEVLKLRDVTKENLYSLIVKIVKDPGYKKRMKEYSAIFRDRPETPLERAVYWTEYAIKHKGAPHLHSAGADLYWYQYYSLDIISFLFVSIIISFWLVIKVFNLVWTLLCGNKCRNKSKQE